MKPLSRSLNRRDFTKTALVAGAAIASGTLSATAENAKRIRVGIIGCGSVSNAYLPVLTKCSYAEVVSLCDIPWDMTGPLKAWIWQRISSPNLNDT